MPINRDESGRISPAQSKVAQRMRGIERGRSDWWKVGETRGLKKAHKTIKAEREAKGTPLSDRTMGHVAAKTSYGGQKSSGKHAYGETHHGVSGMARMETLKEANKGKKNKSRVILRGQKNEYRKAYTKHGARMRKAGMDLG